MLYDKNNNIYGGSFHIPNEELQLFHQLYYNEVIKGDSREYLTEKQQNGDGALIYVDLDSIYV